MTTTKEDALRELCNIYERESSYILGEDANDRSIEYVVRAVLADVEKYREAFGVVGPLGGDIPAK